MSALAILTASILGLLAVLHAYWALGGRWGWDKAVPHVDGKPLFSPGRAVTLLVAGALLLFAGLALVLRWPWPGLGSWPRYAGWLLAGVFLLRAVGDRKYCGLFKRVRHTDFAARDTLLYSPLCLLLGLSFVLLARVAAP